jgi:mannose-6-phosphate isomerase class I
MTGIPGPAYPLELSLSRVRAPWGGWPDGTGEIRSLSGPPLESLVLNGELAGYRLTQLVGRHPEALLGRGAELDAREPFPVRLRFICTGRDLPVTVHPGDGYTLAHQLPAVGQELVLYVVDARREGRLYCGWKEPFSSGRFQTAVSEDAVRDLLHCLRVRPGQAYTIPPGRPYALGAGLTLFEVARHSRAAFHLARARHRELPDDLRDMVEQGAIRPEPIHGIVHSSGDSRIDHLCCTPRFSLRRFSVSGALDLALPGDRFRVYTGLRGSGRIARGFASAGCSVQPHQSVLAPAALEDLMLESGQGMELLEVSLQSLAEGTLREVTELGFTDGEVASLGGPDYGPILMSYLQP